MSERAKKSQIISQEELFLFRNDLTKLKYFKMIDKFFFSIVKCCRKSHLRVATAANEPFSHNFTHR